LAPSTFSVGGRAEVPEVSPCRVSAFQPYVELHVLKQKPTLRRILRDQVSSAQAPGH